MNLIKKNIAAINYILFLLLIIYNLFFDKISISFDFILIIVLGLINIKNIINYLLNHKLLGICLIGFIIYYLLQFIIITQFSLSLLNSVNFFKFLVIILCPIILFIVIDNCKFTKEQINNIKKIYLLSLLIMIIYGLINYMFSYNLSYSGMHVLNNTSGRIMSFFSNPNGYALFLLISLNFILYLKFNKNYIKWIYVFLIIISICLTFGRFIYLLMLISIIIYIIYILIKEKTYKNIFIIFLFMYGSLYLPNNNYLYISLLNEFDSRVHTNITVTCDKIVDSVVFVDYSIDSSKLINKISNANDTEYSSNSTRSLFKKYALEMFNKNKLIGVGYYNYHATMQEYFNRDKIDYVTTGLPHNFYVLLLSSVGIIGFILFAGILISILIILIKSKKNIISNIILFVIMLISNLEGDFMFGTYFSYILFTLNMNLEYNKNVSNKED